MRWFTIGILRLFSHALLSSSSTNKDKWDSQAHQETSASQYCATDRYPCTSDPLVTYPSCSSSHFSPPFYYKNWEEVAKTQKAAQTPQKSPIQKPTPPKYNASYSLRLFTNKWRQIGCLIIHNAANLYSARHYVKMSTLFALTCAISLSVARGN